ncbi:DUF5683 domain-containing protein [Flavihumibacter petaseus]|uniref:DUF5683 domain-containing protein n=1 Tax=Flavihumibacter petaseus NBRC 106054 TaxID=1220578 RepID=A0A0E9N0K1_9BACT|nr:DUF5683 domain-containing protein [Flavihumibacter petaseus]GAO43313.1 hypothetical protein FPE01S_02_04180 [Flavihumibacter petaseus NBRC 106054]
MKSIRIWCLLLLGIPGLLATRPAIAQVRGSLDSVTAQKMDVSPLNIDDTTTKHSPRKAAIRSAIIPGWGQAYNKKYWKIPIVYAALGITGAVFINNVKTYNEVNYAYKVSVNKLTDEYDDVADYLKPFVPDETTSLDNYRREFRRNIDYSVLIFMLFWGLNVVDATVDAHLKDFDVSPNISMRIKPTFPGVSSTGSAMATAGFSPGTAGLSLAFDIHKAKRSAPLSVR